MLKADRRSCAQTTSSGVRNPGRLLSNLRARSAWARRARSARLSQVDHARGRLRAHPRRVRKGPNPTRALIVVLGGPAMLIIRGGAASSVSSGASHEDLDFAFVQRDNAEMRMPCCQEVIDRCWQLGDKNPVVSIHDVGAGGLSNALPELVNDSGRGARFELRRIPNDEPSMSPLELWCNESQERYVLHRSPRRSGISRRCAPASCPAIVLGITPPTTACSPWTTHTDNQPIALPLQVLLGKPPKMTRTVSHGSFVLRNR